MHSALCTFDTITALTKLLHEAKYQMGARIEPKAVHIDFKSEKRYKELIEENYQKPKQIMQAGMGEEEKNEEEGQLMQMDGSTREATAASKKSPEAQQIEEEYNALMQ